MDAQDAKNIELGQANKQLLMIMRPTNFLQSEHTKQDNHFMREHDFTDQQIIDGSKKEHAELEKLFAENNIAYKCWEQTNPDAHDCVYLSDSMICLRNEDFPKGICFICPMFWPNRRLEKFPEIYEWVKTKLGYEEVIDLSYFQDEDKALEGKGVTLFDFKARCLYVGETKRAHKDVIAKVAEIMSEKSGKKWEYFLVQNWDEEEQMTHFHTSSYMMIYEKCAVVCSSVLKTPEHFQEIKTRLEASGKEVYECSYDDMENGATLGIEYYQADGTNGLLLSDFCADIGPEAQAFFDKHFKNQLYLEAPILVDVGGSSLECLIQTVPL
jgi:hypothetical protein